MHGHFQVDEESRFRDMSEKVDFGSVCEKSLYSREGGSLTPLASASALAFRSNCNSKIKASGGAVGVTISRYGRPNPPKKSMVWGGFVYIHNKKLLANKFCYLGGSSC